MKKFKFCGLIICVLSSVILLINILNLTYVSYTNKIKINNFYSNYNSKNYFGLLKVPKIKLNNVIYPKDSKFNNINKNIFLVEHVSDSFIVLASHSGNSPISFFKNLNLLKINDTISFLLKDKSRTYEVFKIDMVNKIGRVKLQKYKYPVIVLITCSKNFKNKQEIYYTRLVKTTKISKNS